MEESAYIGKLSERFYREHPQGFFYKIPDAHDGQQRPYDGFFLLPKEADSDPKFVAFEAKLHKSLSPWHFNKIEPHQIYNLRRVNGIGFPSYVVLGIRCLDLSAKDLKAIGQDHSQVYVDIWIPAEIIPGKDMDISVSTLDVRSLISDRDICILKGGRVNEIHMSKERLERYSNGTGCNHAQDPVSE